MLEHMSDEEWEVREPPEWLDNPAPTGVFDAVNHPDEAAAALAATHPAGPRRPRWRPLA
jgi:hypothetical protein